MVAPVDGQQGVGRRSTQLRNFACHVETQLVEDDATSQLMEIRFVDSESTFDYFAATQSYLESHGKPAAFYSDQASIFRITASEPCRAGGLTQFSRALTELNIDIVCANSPQAKGRVERAHLTLQDRLVKELRLREISSQEAANAYAPEFIEDYNKRFAKEPLSAHDAHRPVRDDENLALMTCPPEIGPDLK